jgi:hypothetical protein
MRYFNLNIKHYTKDRRGLESHSKIWLTRDKPQAPIFFGDSKIEDILHGEFNFKGRSRAEARQFCLIGLDPTRRDETTIITIDDGYVWIYKPVGEITESKNWEGYNENVKSFPVEILAEKQVKDVPLILASMKSNQAFSRGTFAEIKERYFGNILAIEYLLGNRVKVPSRFSPLDCLSSLEFETLVAKIFETHGCFVPAYKGGYMKDIDLIAKNYTEKEIFMDGLYIPSKSTISIQVKLRFENKQPKRQVGVDYNIGLDIETNEFNFGREWILKQTEIPLIKDWLTRSTEWLSNTNLR